MATINQQEQLVEHGDHWTVPLQGKTVTRCLMDRAFGMELWERDGITTIRIEGEFVFQGDGGEHRLSPAHPTAFGPILSTMGKAVASAKACKARCLTVHFTDGSLLSVQPDVAYEAWEIAGTGGLRVVCTPGGSLSIWQPARADDRL